ncbi:hypothetical protein PTSG_02344 [Salpingoeca rosetta]|uniref:Uncharacterized protein n=1 Tax=Salpingoeca rosetta (strain ATCC 50818 / BSB-021) TaxID=946362 RepID=F2U1X6_SALR5|nr:uncharacterized protein PTSG_02344 [Salpingoeca rosetta]EGD81628.1 hypothetical protein PTSG_02344 [Salpingoeca rosetta]|eukprot:XP_004996832.1 hypothetical protein PTSG_02344 [Salpingoeca rosetta]
MSEGQQQNNNSKPAAAAEEDTAVAIAGAMRVGGDGGGGGDGGDGSSGARGTATAVAAIAATATGGPVHTSESAAKPSQHVPQDSNKHRQQEKQEAEDADAGAEVEADEEVGDSTAEQETEAEQAWPEPVALHPRPRRRKDRRRKPRSTSPGTGTPGALSKEQEKLVMEALVARIQQKKGKQGRRKTGGQTKSKRRGKQHGGDGSAVFGSADGTSVQSDDADAIGHDIAQLEGEIAALERLHKVVCSPMPDIYPVKMPHTGADHTDDDARLFQTALKVLGVENAAPDVVPKHVATTVVHLSRAIDLQLDQAGNRWPGSHAGAE